MRIVFNAGHAKATRTTAGIRVDLDNGECFTPQKVIFATGRVGNTEDLNLAAAGIETDRLGRVVVDEHFRTTAEGIYAAGDVVGPPALASVSMEQARIAARWAFDLPLKGVADSVAPYGVYSIPEAAMVGLTETAAEAAGIDHAVGRAAFANNTRGAIRGATTGMVKLVFARADLRLLGVHIIGESATELVHIGQMVIQFGGTIEHFVHSPFNVPTLAEAYKYAAYDGLRNAGR
jgi:NAD(P) transhydrogenase